MKLSTLFDYQRFEKNPELQKLIDDVENKYSVTKLSDDELELLSAAGDIHAAVKKPEDGG